MISKQSRKIAKRSVRKKRKNPNFIIPSDRILKNISFFDLIEYINQIPDVKKLKGSGWDNSDYYKYIIDLSDRELLDYIKVLTAKWLELNRK